MDRPFHQPRACACGLRGLARRNRAAFGLYRKGSGRQHLGTTTSALGGALSSLFPMGLAAVSFLIFTLLYTPCIAAIATVRKELRSVGSTVAVVALQCGVAWVMSTLVFNIGSLLI